MRHRVAGRKLGRTREHRLALLRNLSTALFDKEKITTTLVKAKELRPFAERLVTLSKKETLHARRMVLRHIHDRTVVGKLFDTLSARYAQRPGGYTRILKLGPRRGDHAEMAIIELVGADSTASAKEPTEKAPKRAPRRKKPAAEVQAEPAESKPKPKRKRSSQAESKPAAKKSSAARSTRRSSPTSRKGSTKGS